MGTQLALLLIKLAPTIISIVANLVQWLHDKQLLDAGDARAVARALAAAAQARGLAGVVRAEAAKAHASDPTDAAYDQTFKRKD